MNCQRQSPLATRKQKPLRRVAVPRAQLPVQPRLRKRRKLRPKVITQLPLPQRRKRRLATNRPRQRSDQHKRTLIKPLLNCLRIFSTKRPRRESNFNVCWIASCDQHKFTREVLPREGSYMVLLDINCLASYHYSSRNRGLERSNVLRS